MDRSHAGAASQFDSRRGQLLDKSMLRACEIVAPKVHF
jgi:hypothetical protein